MTVSGMEREDALETGMHEFSREERARPATHDEILNGRLKLWQPPEGPRVNMDTILLAAYVRLKAMRSGSFLELGSAAGAISLILALRFPHLHITGVEIQPELHSLALRNIKENKAAEQVSALCMDLREHRLMDPASFDGIVVNPPYEEAGRGRESPVRAVSVARHDACCSLRDVAEASHYLLKEKGRFFAILRSTRMAEFLSLMAENGIEPKRLRLIHPREGKRSNLFLVEGIKSAAPGLIAEPPLFVYEQDGVYTAELLQAYELEGLPCL